MSLSDDQSLPKSLLTLFNFLAAILSIIGSILMIIMCLRSRARKYIEMKLLLGIGLADFLFAISNIMSQFDNDLDHGYCVFEGFLREFSSYMTGSFIVSTALLCYQNSRMDYTFDHERFSRIILAISIFIALLLSSLPLYVPWIIYGRDKIFCWVIFDESQMISSSLSTSTMQLIILAVFEAFPLAVGVIMCFTGYIMAIINYNRIARKYSGSSRKSLYMLLMYPILFFVIFISSLIDNVILVFDPNRSSWIEVVHVMLFHGMGFLNAIIYGIQAKAWNKTLEKQEKVISRKETTENSIQQDLLAAQII